MEIKTKIFNSLQELTVDELPAEYIVTHSGVKFEFYYSPSHSDIMYVFSPGYLNRDLKEHPYYQRIRWFEEIDRNGLVLTDPTLNLSTQMGIAWMQGTSEQHYLALYAEVIKRIFELVGIKEERTMFYGSSAGGFASLMFLSYFPKSFAVVNNPQTNIFEFERKHVRKLLDVSFGAISTELAKSRYMPRFSVSESYRLNKSVPRFIYIQNSADIEHYEKHYLKFTADLQDLFGSYCDYSLNECMFVLYRDSISKHNPAVYNFIKKYFFLAEQLFL